MISMVAFDLVVFVVKHIVAIVMSNMVWISVKLVFTIIGKIIVIAVAGTVLAKPTHRRHSIRLNSVRFFIIHFEQLIVARQMRTERIKAENERRFQHYRAKFNLDWDNPHYTVNVSNKTGQLMKRRKIGFV